MLFVVKNICEKNFKMVNFLVHHCDSWHNSIHGSLLSAHGVMYNCLNNKLIVITEMMHVHYTFLCVHSFVSCIIINYIFCNATYVIVV